MVVSQFTSFIGRQRELAEIAALLVDPACRLLTLVGPGGIGKTRLALEVANPTLNPSPLHGEGLEKRFPQGVHFVPLQPVSDPALLPIAIANAMGIQFFGADEPRVQLLGYLRERHTLLILDNFEHLLDGLDFVVELLSAPGVRLLVTSRAALNIQAEWRFAVGGLGVPLIHPHPPSPSPLHGEGESKPLALRPTEVPVGRERGEGLEQYDAVKLFTERARRLRHDFDPANHRDDVIRICQLTEGMPLGLELAAGWLKALSCAQIADEIQRGLDFLAAGARDVPERHRSMAAAFSQSWHMLTDDEQKIFRRMSVFRGGFTREAAENVTGATLQSLAALVDKSFLRVDAAGRYDVHELLRQYGEAKLEAAGEVEAVRDAHCSYFAEFMRQREERLKSHDEVQACNEIAADFENVHLMWLRAIAQRDHSAVNQAVESLYVFDVMRRPFQAHRILFSKARECFTPPPGDAPTLTWARLVVREYWGSSSLHAHDRAQALMRVEQAVQIARQAGKITEIAFSLYQYGNLIASENAAEAIQWYQESLRHYEATGDIYHRAHLLHNIAFTYANTRRLQQARNYYRKGLEISRAHNIQSATAPYLSNLGVIEALGAGQYTSGITYLREAMTICHDLGSPVEVARHARWLSFLYFMQGDFDSARALAEKARDTALELGQSELLGITQSIWGMLANLHGDCQDGLKHCQQSLQNSTRKPILVVGHWALVCTYCGLGDIPQADSHLRAALLNTDDLATYPGIVLCCLPAAAYIHYQYGNPKRAAALLSLAFSHPKAAAGWLKQWSLITQLRTDLETALGTTAYDAAWEWGKNLGLETVVTEILVDGNANDNLLTAREYEVLRLVADGLSNAQIAERLVVSIGTAKTHVHNIYGKLGVETRAQVIVRIRELHLV